MSTSSTLGTLQIFLVCINISFLLLRSISFALSEKTVCGGDYIRSTPVLRNFFFHCIFQR
jgi:hypothetical protein